MQVFRTVFGMMINPSGTLKSALSESHWALAPGVSALAFTLFFLQTGLDLYKTGQKGFSYVWLALGSGFLYGLLVIPVLGVIAWGFLKTFRMERNLKDAVASMCLSYSGALVYGIIGLIFSLLLGWKTAVAFGVTGVLWAVGPMMVGIREMSGGNNVLSMVISAAISVIVLFSWSFWGNL